MIFSEGTPERKVGTCAQVEEELAKWQCNKYTHITRAVPISTDQRSAPIIKLETIFSRPAQDLIQ